MCGEALWRRRMGVDEAEAEVAATLDTGSSGSEGVGAELRRLAPADLVRRLPVVLRLRGGAARAKPCGVDWPACIVGMERGGMPPAGRPLGLRAASCSGDGSGAWESGWGRAGSGGRALACGGSAMFVRLAGEAPALAVPATAAAAAAASGRARPDEDVVLLLLPAAVVPVELDEPAPHIGASCTAAAERRNGR